jgi:hypothetical protein
MAMEKRKNAVVGLGISRRPNSRFALRPSCSTASLKCCSMLRGASLFNCIRNTVNTIHHQSCGLSSQIPEPQPASIYIHYPYCAMICSYCDFNKYLSGPHVHPQKIMNAYISELAYFKGLCSTLIGERTISSIYFGGMFY